jgi:hypothetical protein
MYLLDQVAQNPHGAAVCDLLRFTVTRRLLCDANAVSTAQHLAPAPFCTLIPRCHAVYSVELRRLWRARLNGC